MEFSAANAALDASTFNQPAYLRYPETKSGNEDVPNLAPTNEDVGRLVSTSKEATASSSTDLSEYYDMTGDKYLIIFNHFEYEETEFYLTTFEEVPSTRHGTHRDVESLNNTFRNLGFSVITHNDLECEEIKNYLAEFCSNDHRNTSCVAVAVMTHGIGEYLCAADRLYPRAAITDKLLTEPSLAGKPKLFFIQACREKHTKYRPPPDLPMDVHCLIFYSTYEDYVSIREPRGTWFMQALCQVLNEYHKDMDLADMTVLVNKMVSEESLTENWGKQQSVSQYRLTKYLIFS